MDIRQMKTSDLVHVLDIQGRCYPKAYHEPRSAFDNKLRLSPESSWLATSAEQVQAYLVALPADETHFPALHAADWSPPSRARWLCIHDLAVHPDHRGAGAAPRLIDRAAAHARQMGLEGLVLVAVEGAEAYWARQGFTPVHVSHAGLRERLASFGGGALFMVRPADEPS